MSPIQQMLLGVGAVDTKTFVDDVFSTYVYTGTGSSQSINNGLDLSGEGGMTWIKARSLGASHIINDTVRGAGNRINSNGSGASSSGTAFLSAFNSNGFSIGNDNDVSYDDQTFTSWSFRRASGFFDVVTWTGNGTAGRTISHNLGSVPGCIMVKCTSTDNNWGVYHRSTKATHYLQLNTTNGSASDSGLWNNVEPTATNFTLGDGGTVNDNGDTYVAYLFAGGESTAATARSVDLDGSGDYFTTSTSSDYTFGTGDFTVEHWIKINGSTSGQPTLLDARTTGSYTTQWVNYINTDNTYNFYTFGVNRLVSTPLAIGTWNHVALVRYSGTTTLYLNGTSQGSYSDSNNYSNQSIVIGCNALNFGHQTDGQFSNLRIVKGTALYTSSFKSPTEPLANVTNTKLLCFNNSSTTGTTVGTITASGNPTASTDSPFDDPAGFVFGDAGDQNVIKCGSYVGNGSSTGPEINLGWEPSWILLKNASTGSTDWLIIDEMRGISADSQKNLRPNKSDTEGLNEWLNVSSTGFQIKSTSSYVNTSGDTYIFMCLRRSDGYVGKPPELGTDVFNIGAGQNSAPGFIAGFPVDWAMARDPDTGGAMYTGARLQGEYALGTHDSSAQFATTSRVFDYNNGWNISRGANSPEISWMWKRHAGFDVVIYTGNDVRGRHIPHSLNAVPEMMIIKTLSTNYGWCVYHKGLNGGTNPEQKFLLLNTTDAEAAAAAVRFNNTAPTSTHFIVGEDGEVNGINSDGTTWDYMAMLFASVDGISKVGSFDGQSSDLTVTFGFQPRFLIVKRVDSTGDWNVFDTTRGLDTTSNDKELRLNDTSVQSNHEVGQPTSNGFTFACGGTHDTCHAGGKWIYYAHA